MATLIPVNTDNYLGILDWDPGDFRRSNRRSTKIWDTGQPRKIQEKFKWTFKKRKENVTQHSLVNLSRESKEELKKMIKS